MCGVVCGVICGVVCCVVCGAVGGVSSVTQCNELFGAVFITLRCDRHNSFN